MTIDWAQVGQWGTGISALILSICSLFLVFSQRKKNQAEASKAVNEAANAIAEAAEKSVKLQSEQLQKELDARIEDRKAIHELQAKVSVMQGELDKMTRRYAVLQVGVERLVHQIRSLGHEPVYDPEKDQALK